MENLKDLGIAGVLILLTLKELFSFLQTFLSTRKDERETVTDLRGEYVSQAILEIATQTKAQTALLESCVDGHRDHTAALGRLEGKIDSAIRSTHMRN